MNLNTYKQATTETNVAINGLHVSVNTWANSEGCNLMVIDAKTNAMRMAGSFRWEEVSAILVALTAAKEI